MDNFNVAVLGVCNVGKTAYIIRISEGDFVKSSTNLPSQVDRTCSIKVMNNESVYLNINLHEFSNLDILDNDYDGCIVLFNRENPVSVTFALNKIMEIYQLGIENVVLCCTKMDTDVDLIGNDLLDDLDSFSNENNIPLVYVSSKSNMNIGQPIEEVAKLMCDNNTLELTQNDPIEAPEIYVDDIWALSN